MISKFTLKKSSRSKIKQINNLAVGQSGNRAVRQSGNQAVGQSGKPAIRQSVVLNFFLVIITFSIVTIIPSFQPLKADALNPCKVAATECGGVDIDILVSNEYCSLIKGTCTSLKVNNCATTSTTVCTGGGFGVSQTCSDPCGDARKELRELITAARQEQRTDERECQQARRELNRINLPPGCRTRTSRCQTDAEKCRDLRGRLGAGRGLTGLGSGGGSLGISSVLQNQLASQCPQAAAAKFESDDRRLRDVTNDFQEAQDKVYDLQGDLQKGVEEMQTDRVRIEREIQQTTSEMERASAEFEGTTARLSEQMSGQMAGLKNQAAGINRQIRARITQLERIQNNDNNAADRALIAYKAAIRGIFTQCDREAKQDVEVLRARLNTQLVSGKAASKLQDATRESRIESLRQTAIRSYAKCRSSQRTQNQVQEALEQYRMDQRIIARREQELIDEIDSLREELEGLRGQSHDIVTSGDRAYQAAHTAYVSELQSLGHELQLKNFEKQNLDANFGQQQQQLQTQLYHEQTRATQLNGEMIALEQTVQTSRPTSAFGRLDYGDYRSLDDYERAYDYAYNICCPDGKGSDRICQSGGSARSHLRSSGGTK